MKINEFKLERFFAKYEFTAPYLLCSSDCESWTIEELLSMEEGSEEAFKKLRLGYTESTGSPVLRSNAAFSSSDFWARSPTVLFIFLG